MDGQVVNSSVPTARRQNRTLDPLSLREQINIEVGLSSVVSDVIFPSNIDVYRP